MTIFVAGAIFVVGVGEQMFKLEEGFLLAKKTVIAFWDPGITSAATEIASICRSVNGVSVT